MHGGGNINSRYTVRYPVVLGKVSALWQAEALTL